MSNRNDYAVSVATLAMGLARLPLADGIDTRSDHRFILASVGLHKLGQRASSLAVRFCNGWVTDDQYEKRRAGIEKKALAAVDGLHIEGLSICVGGDPRGYCLKIKHPSLQGNSFGGQSEGYGV